jgi:hypothetical protein
MSTRLGVCKWDVLSQVVLAPRTAARRCLPPCRCYRRAVRLEVAKLLSVVQPAAVDRLGRVAEQRSWQSRKVVSLLGAQRLFCWKLEPIVVVELLHGPDLEMASARA